MSHSFNEKDLNTNDIDILHGEIKENIHEPETSKDDDYIQPPDGGRGWLVVFGSFIVRLFNFDSCIEFLY
jgi:hypothetical protein